MTGPRKRPSGAGSNSTRFAEITNRAGERIKIPVVKDAATLFYRAIDGERWPTPRDPQVIILRDLQLDEGDTFRLTNLTPGAMGQTGKVLIIAAELEVLFSEKTKYGQHLRHLLFVDAPELDELSDALLGGDDE